MAWTQADLDALDAALAGGSAIQSMTFTDQSFTFRTIDDMLKLRAVIAAALAAAASPSSGYRLAATSKGV
jgi:hypothetical protein